MQLLTFMHDMPIWIVAVVVTIAAEVFSVGLMLTARYAYGVSRLSLNNEVAGFKFAVVGVFYSVLLAFVVIAVWETYTETDGAVRDEAKAVVDLQLVIHALPLDGGAEISKNLIAYAEDVPAHEWPTMAVGQASPIATMDLRKLSTQILALEPATRRDLALYQDALRLLTEIADNRMERLESANGSVPAILWTVLVLGGVITLGYPAFFASSNLAAQILMTASLAALVAMSLVLALAFDFPFTGDPHISSVPFETALEHMPESSP
jgi:hypothetical protein